MSLTSQTTFVVCLWIEFQNFHRLLHYKASTFVNRFPFAILMRNGTISAEIVNWFLTPGEFFFNNFSAFLDPATRAAPILLNTLAEFGWISWFFFHWNGFFSNLAQQILPFYQAPCLLQQHFTRCFSFFTISFCRTLFWRGFVFTLQKLSTTPLEVGAPHQFLLLSSRVGVFVLVYNRSYS